MALNDRQRLFIATYVERLNATQAAIEAGYSAKTAYSIGSRLLRHVEIRAEIDRLFGERTMGAGEVLGRLTDQARSNLADLISIVEHEVTVGKGKAARTQKVRYAKIDLEAAKETGALRNIRKLKIGAKGDISIDLYDAQKALALLGRHHYVLGTDKPDTEDDDDTDEITDEEIARELGRD